MKKRLWWWDAEHASYMGGYVHFLNRSGWHVNLTNDPSQVYDVQKDLIFHEVETPDMLLFHCGRVSVDWVINMLKEVKTRFPNCIVGLQTEAVSPFLKSIIDFSIPMRMQDTNKFLNMLDEAFARGRRT